MKNIYNKTTFYILLGNLPILLLLFNSYTTSKVEAPIPNKVEQATGLDYYWVGGTGMWSDYGAHWATTSGGSTFHDQVPTSMDNVFFDGNSFSGAGQTVMVDETIIYCMDMDWTAATNNPTIEQTGSNVLHIHGSLSLTTGMTFNLSTYRFLANSIGNTIISVGHTLGALYFEGIGGEWTLQDDLTASIVRHYHGVFLSNDKDITVGSWDASSSANDAIFNLGTSTLTFPSFTYANMYYQKANFGASTAHLIFQSGGNLQGSNDLDYYNVSFLSGNPGSLNEGNILNKVLFEDVGILNSYGIHNINEAEFQNDGFFNSNDSFETLKLTAGKIYTFQENTTQTINPTGTLIASGNNCNDFITFKSANSGQQATIFKTGSSLNFDFLILSDIIASGGATFNTSNSIDLGNNVGWTISTTTPRDLFWVGGDGNWDDNSHWSLTSGGAGGACIPSAYDNIFFDVNSGFAVNASVNVNLPLVYCNNMTWAGVQNMPTLTGNNAQSFNIYGSLIFDANMVNQYPSYFTFSSTNTGNIIQSNGLFLGAVRFNGVGGD